MVDNPLFILLVAVALFIFFLAVFAFFTYLFLKLAADLKREETKKK
jgi:ACR3 family arsenite efflux pump ArsB